VSARHEKVRQYSDPDGTLGNGLVDRFRDRRWRQFQKSAVDAIIIATDALRQPVSQLPYFLV
jgi:hypothetical protein